MLTFRMFLANIKKKPYFSRLKFDLEKLKDPEVVETFQAATGEKIAQLFICNDDGDTDEAIAIYIRSRG